MRYLSGAVLVAVVTYASFILSIALFGPASRGIGAGLGTLLAAVILLVGALALLGAGFHYRRYRDRRLFVAIAVFGLGTLAYMGWQLSL